MGRARLRGNRLEDFQVIFRATPPADRAKHFGSRLVIDGERVVAEHKLLDDRGWRIRALAQGPEGHIYVAVDAGDAPILRLSPAQ